MMILENKIGHSFYFWVPCHDKGQNFEDIFKADIKKVNSDSIEVLQRIVLVENGTHKVSDQYRILPKGKFKIIKEAELKFL